MTRLVTMGFETGEDEWNGAVQSNIYAPAASTTYKRTGGYSCLIYNATISSVDNWFRHVLDENQTELYGRLALLIRSAASQNTFDLIEFADENNSKQFSIRYSPGTQTFSWHDGGGTRLGTLGNVLIPVDTWIMMEFHAVVDNSTGSLTLKINGTTDAVYASGDTDYTNAGNIRSLYFGYNYVSGSVSEPTLYIDDIGINNAEGSYQNSWLGLGGIFYLEPVADGDQNDWTPSAGSDNYAMVDDIPPDNATTFNQGQTAGEIELYEVDDCPLYINTINLVEVVYRAALATSGYNELTDLVKTAGTVYQGLEYTIVPITPSFTYYKGTAHYINPQTGTAWGTAEVNAMQAGVEITV